MASRHDLLIRLDSEFSDKGFRSAEQSARTLERELAKQEAAQRSMAAVEAAAYRESERRRAAQLMGMTALGKGFTAVGLLAAAGLGLAGKAAMDWETAWAGVTKTVDGSATEMAALESQLRGLAKVLPATHEEIAAVAEAAGQLGVKRQDIAGFTKTMIDLGVSTNLSADEAATGIAQISNVMGTMAREGTAGVSKFGATLVALGNAGASTERDILAMAQRLAGAGKMIGASESDVLALSNAMSSLGIEAELGGGAMSRTMIKINSAVKEGGAGLEDFARVSGMSATEFAAKWQSDPVSAIDSFIKGLARVNSSGGDAAKTLADLGLSGTQNAQVLLRMTGAGDQLTQSLDLGNRAWAENSALVDEANKRYETAASRVAIARNNLNDAAIDIGANVLPAFAGAAERVGFLAESFGHLPGPVKEAVTVLGGIVMSVGLLGGATLLLIPKLVAMNATLAASGPAGAAAARGMSAVGGALMGPWGIALAGATLALGVFAERNYQAQQRSDELRATLDQATGAITEQTKALLAQDLQESGMIARARDLGVSRGLLLRAYSGEADALAELVTMQKQAETSATTLGAKTGELEESFGLAGASTIDWTGASDDASQSAAVQSAGLDALLSKVQPMNQQMVELTKAQGEVAGTTAEAGGAMESAAGSTDTYTAAQVQARQETAAAQKELDDLIASVEGYGDTVNNALDATSAYEAALDDANAALKENGRTANKSGTAINLHTEAGRANDKALRGIATSALQAATANFENGRSVKSVTGDVTKARAEFIDMAVKMGMSKEAAGRLASQLGLTRGNVNQLSDAIGKTPTSHNTKMSVETETARAELRAFQAAIDALRGRTVTVRYVRTGVNPGGGRSTAGGSTFDAEGSIHEFFSGGGYATLGDGGGHVQYAPPIGPQQPQIRQAGGAGMTWAEHGAGPWEAYISGNPDKHARSMAIWEDTGRRLGAFEPMRTQPAVIVEGSKSIDRSTHVTAYGHNADDVAKAIAREEAKKRALHPEFGG